MKIIVAMSKNRVIGVKGEIPWHIPSDLKNFKRITMGHIVVMGRKTFESIRRPLPHRTNVVITRNKDFQAEGVTVINSFDEVRELFKDQWDDVFIIGGGEVYREFIEEADGIYVTLVDTTIQNGDALFPQIPDKFDVYKTSLCHFDGDEYPYEYRIYSK